MRVPIKCAHPFVKRKDYGPGWMCEPERGGCGATGAGEDAHYNPIIGWIDMPDPSAKLLEAATAAFELITTHCPDCFGSEGDEVREKLRVAIRKQEAP